MLALLTEARGPKAHHQRHLPYKLQKALADLDGLPQIRAPEPLGIALSVVAPATGCGRGDAARGSKEKGRVGRVPCEGRLERLHGRHHLPADIQAAKRRLRSRPQVAPCVLESLLELGAHTMQTVSPLAMIEGVRGRLHTGGAGRAASRGRAHLQHRVGEGQHHAPKALDLRGPWQHVALVAGASRRDAAQGGRCGRRRPPVRAAAQAHGHRGALCLPENKIDHDLANRRVVLVQQIRERGFKRNVQPLEPLVRMAAGCQTPAGLLHRR
mmetsp:Transcript_129114/g.373692  ORF Transcript_129114/g.373692 Transcript_129114/m.373692 type:complete len:269 (-) Transcript_129114:59-865(-)